MIKKYGVLLVLALFLNGCYTQFAVIREQVPVQRVSYQIDSTGDTVKVISQVDTVTKIKNCYWVRNYWGQPEYRCDGDNGYYSASDYYNSSWYNYNDQPWWYRSYSYYDGAFYSSSYYGQDHYYGGGGGGGGTSTSTQSNGAIRHSRTYGVSGLPSTASSSSSSTGNSKTTAELGNGSFSVGSSSGSSTSSTSNGGNSSSSNNNSGNQEQGRHNPRSW